MKYQIGVFTQVELRLHESKPVYLTPSEARELSRLLKSCADHAEKNQRDLNNQEPWTIDWT